MNKTILYSRISILIFSILLSLIGVLMFIYNLRAVNKNRVSWPLVIASLLVNAILRNIVKLYLRGSVYSLFIPNLIIGLLLAFPVWDKYLGEIQFYRSKNIWIPLIAEVVLYGGTTLVIFIAK
jgi:FtsH-binding integral membrane protein